MAKMTPKQKRFVEEYLVDLNATQAAIRAGYSPKTATVIGAETLTKPYVSAAIEKALAERSRRTGINQDRVIRELARIAFVKISDVVTEEGKIRTDAASDDLACIESYKVKNSDGVNGTSTECEVRLASKLKALELLGKHLGMWNDKLTVDLTIPVYEGDGDLED